MIAVKTEKLRHVYSPQTPFEKVAVDDFSLEIEEGEFVGVIGHTGSGKSTFLQHLNGLMKPTSGKVFIHGRDMWADPKKIREFRFMVGLVFQYPEYQLFEETVEKDIAFGPTNMGLSAAEISDRVRTAAEFVGLAPEVMQKSPFELSGGQKRRVAIAGIIAMRPEVLVLDEPAAGLDPRGRREILGGLLEYVKENDASIILVSHSMEDMAYYCDNVVVMNKSEIYKSGTVDEIFSDADSLSEIGLDVPVVAKIASSLRKSGISLTGELYTVDGVKDAIIRYIGGEKK